MSPINKSENDDVLLNKKIVNFLSYKSSLSKILDLDESFNIKNYYCPINFGYSNGAHYDHITNAYLPLSTSYINSFYDCLINENGDLTEKYFLAEMLLQFGIQNIAEKKFDLGYLQMQYKKLKPSKMNGDSDHSIQLNASHILYLSKMIELMDPSNKLINNNNDINMEYLNAEQKSPF